MGLDWRSLPPELTDDYVNLLVGNAVLPSVANAIAKALRIFWHPTVWAAVNRQSVPRTRWVNMDEAPSAGTDEPTTTSSQVAERVDTMNTNQVAERTNDSSCGVRDPCRLGDNWHRTFNTIYRQATVWVSVTPAARASDVLRALRTSAWREDACLFSRRRQDHYIRPDIIISSIRKLRKRVLKFSLSDNTDARDETLEYAGDSLIVRVPRSPLYLEVKIHFASAAEAPRSNLAAWKYDLTKGPLGTILERRIPVHHPPMRELSHKLGLAGPRSSEQRMMNPTLFDECSTVVRQSVSEMVRTLSGVPDSVGI